MNVETSVANPGQELRPNIPTLLDAARSAYAAGLCVIPVKSDGTKAPDVGAWGKYQARRPTAQQMRAFGFARRDGFGIVSGAVSGHVAAFDFDDRETFDAYVQAAADSKLGPVVDRIRHGYEDRTPSGGVRWLVHYPPSSTWGDKTLASRPGRVGEPKIKTLIELPTFAIVAPSNGSTHPTGEPYVNMAGGFSSIANVDDAEYGALIELARSFDQMPRRSIVASQPSSSAAGDRPGDDYNRRSSWPDILEPAGWTAVFTRGETTHWRRPGKSFGVSATTNHGGSDLFYPFSSSTEFEAGRSYDRFAVYTTLHHGGDFSAAAQALGAQGYGAALSESSAAHAADPNVAPDHHTGRRTVMLTPASEITIRPVHWLWEGRLALGAFALLGGREGIGKTIVADTLAADITRGRLPGAHFGTPRAVLIGATEDSWEHTIVPRLMAAGADLSRIYRVNVVSSEHHETGLVLPLDLAALAGKIADVGAALLILDPLLSRLDAALDTHKDADVRQALEPLAALADKSDVCILGLIHVNKSTSQDPLTTLMASRAFAAVARAVLFAMTDPDDDTKRLLGQAKNNLGRMDLPTLAYQIVGVKVGDTSEGPVWTGKLEWLGEAQRSLRDALHASIESGTGDRTALSEAADWLSDYMTSEGGTVESATAKKDGRSAGHSPDTLKRALKRLGIVVEPRGFPRRTFWRLPFQSEQPVGASLGETTPTAPTAPTGGKALQFSQLVQSVQSAESPRGLHPLRTVEPLEGEDDAANF